jgi:aryl-alcohol dehydrogenase-like predicted oxidoreductase
MQVDQIDLLQFHWWDYTNKNYYDAVNFLMALKEKEIIK